VFLLVVLTDKIKSNYTIHHRMPKYRYAAFQKLLFFSWTWVPKVLLSVKSWYQGVYITINSMHDEVKR
jgi:hypothetical protein